MMYLIVVNSEKLSIDFDINTAKLHESHNKKGFENTTCVMGKLFLERMVNFVSKSKEMDKAFKMLFLKL